ncbi:MAG: hypothetical protein GY851_29295 [bacterium]|nr:hypothetical protein [bacterium]
MVDLGNMKSIAEWPKARKSIIKSIARTLGALPSVRADLQAKTIDETDQAGYTRSRVNYFVDEWTRVTAWLFVPDGHEEMPALLCCHDRTAQGKDEPAGIQGNPLLAFARHYAEMGYVTLAPDCVTAGERGSSRLKAFESASFYADQPEMSMLGKMMADHVHALDVLAELKQVDSARLGVIGHGLGACNALVLSAFDERVQACVASCGFTRFTEDTNAARWVDDDGLTILPKLRESVETKEFPFDWEHVLAMAAPSPILLLTALNDDILAKTKSCGKAAKLAGKIYEFLGESDALCNHEHKDGRCLTPETLALADEWFERWL